MKKGLFCLLLVSLILQACSDNNDCTSGEVDVITLSDLGCNNAERVVRVNSTKELELVRDQTTFDAIVIAPCELDIDWQKYDLVLGSIRLSRGFIGMNNSAVFDCVENRIEMTVEIALSASTDAPTVTWSFLIPKDSDFFIRPLKFD